MKKKQCGFIVHYPNSALLETTAKEIFNETSYAFDSTKPDPFIIDAGSNIGLATLYFKHRYPQAKILCFEPDPTAINFFEKNIHENKLTDITLIKAAVAKNAGKTVLYGQIFSDTPDSRGNSIVCEWGTQRIVTDAAHVDAVTLSSYINSEVDLIKLDIEGAEQQVLEDLAEKFHLIKEIIIEVHTIEKISALNSLAKIKEILENNGFIVTHTEKNTTEEFPDDIAEWVKCNSPKLFLVKAKRKI